MAFRCILRSTRHHGARKAILATLLLGLTAGDARAQSGAREWADASGTFKVTASLVEVKDDSAYLRTPDGKTLRIPLSRLSQADQMFLKGDANPFEEISAGGPAASLPSAAAPAAAAPSASPQVAQANAVKKSWSGEAVIDWDAVPELDVGLAGGEWEVKPPASPEGFAAKRAALPKKTTFFEDLRGLEVNPAVKRAVAGFNVTFADVPQSRVSLIDLPTGRGSHSAPVEGAMVPLALLDDGTTVVMRGAGESDKGTETPDQLQLWHVAGKKPVRSALWVPFPEESESWGKTVNAKVVKATALPGGRLMLLSEGGHLACINAATREPFWHARLSKHSDYDASGDRSLLSVVDGANVMVVDPAAGEVRASTLLEGQPHIDWLKTRWSPSGKRLMVTFTSELRVLEVATGEWTHRYAGEGPLASRNLAYPHDDYALADDHLLIHFPSGLKVCDYQNAKQLACVVGGTLVGLQEADGGVILPMQLPHPAAEEMLERAEKSPDTFLVHPGVEVSIDAGGAGQHSAAVAESLKAAAEASGYKVVPSAPITIVASITGPKQEAVSYIARGSYIANVYTSAVKLRWQGKDLWSRSGSNFPFMIHTDPGQTIQQKLDEIGKAPDLGLFKSVEFPKLLQRPAEGESNQSNALLVAKFGPRGVE